MFGLSAAVRVYLAKEPAGQDRLLPGMRGDRQVGDPQRREHAQPGAKSNPEPERADDPLLRHRANGLDHGQRDRVALEQEEHAGGVQLPLPAPGGDGGRDVGLCSGRQDDGDGAVEAGVDAHDGGFFSLIRH
jgi:hypothetical protein